MCHYQSLGLDASQRSTIDPPKIRNAFLNMARKHHPDRTKEPSVDGFLRAKLAYEVLYDPLRRREYDASLDSNNKLDEAWDRYGWILSRGSEVAIRLASLVPTRITWKADIDLHVRIARSSLHSPVTITYKRIVHRIEGSVVGFVNETHQISVSLREDDMDYTEELLVVKDAGNDIIQEGKLMTGSLNLDIDLF
jgi:curved DNA-binding protein CbpA